MKKVHLKGSWIIRAPRKEVYRIMSDFENMPKYFPAVARSVRIVKQEDRHLIMKAEVKTFGLVFSVHMETELRPPVGYVSDNRSAITEGHEEFLMEEIPEGTKINYTYNVKIKNPILSIFSRLLIERYAMRFWKHAVIDKLKEMLEK